jgi:hypothetical protein
VRKVKGSDSSRRWGYIQDESIRKAEPRSQLRSATGSLASTNRIARACEKHMMREMFRQAQHDSIFGCGALRLSGRLEGHHSFK